MNSKGVSENSSGEITAALQQRYRDPVLPHLAAVNDVLTTLLSHRSVRRYQDKPLPPGTLETLVAAAQSAATSSNMQMCSIVTVEDTATRSRLADLSGNQEHIRRAPLFLVWLADLSRADRIGQAHNAPMPGIDYLESFIAAVVDVALAAQNAVIAMESLGLGTVYIGAIRNHTAQVAAELKLPPRVMPLFGLCIGYEDAGPDKSRAAKIKPRLPQRAILHRDQYSVPSEAEAMEQYNERFEAFQKNAGMAAAGWTARVIDRFGSVGAMGSREHIRQELGTLGFELK